MSGNGAPADSSPDMRLTVATITSAVNPAVAAGEAFAWWQLAADYRLGRQRAPIPSPCPDAGYRQRQALRAGFRRRKRDQMTCHPNLVRKRAERCSASAG